MIIQPRTTGLGRARSSASASTTRRRLSLGTILGGGMLALVGMTATPAAAQDECGPAPLFGPGEVTCTTAGNDYNNGITYFAFDELTVNLEDGVNVDTSGTLNIGVLLFDFGNAAFTLNGAGAAITTDSQGGFGVLAATNTGDINLNIGSVTTSGDNAIGIIGSSADGNITIDAGTVTTSGDGADAIQGTTNLGDITIDGFTVVTSGNNANGIFADSDNGDITVTASTVITEGDASTGISADTTRGNIIIGNGSGAVITGGIGSDGVRAVTALGDVGVDLFQVQTTGANSDAIEVSAGSGAVTITASAVTTNGDGSRGIVASGESVSVTQSGFFIGTGGDNANAIQVRARNGNASVSAGNAFTSGDNSTVIDAYSQSGAVTVNAGAVSTSGVNAVGVRAGSGTAGSLLFGIPAAVGGAIQVTGSSIRTQGDGGTGIETTAAFGADTTITANEVTTAGAGATGILATSGVGGLIDINAVRVMTTGAGSNAIQATTTGTGAIDVSTTGMISAAQGTAILLNGGSTVDVTVAAGSSVNGSVAGIDATSIGGTRITNAGTIGSTGGFAIDVDGGAATIVNTGTVNGRIDLSDAADSFTNSAAGRFDAVGTSNFGAGTDTFANAGLLTAFSSATFTGLEAFNNTGLVDLRDGATGDVLTLTGTTFTGGANSQLGLDVSLATGTSDRLVIGTAAGTTSLLLADASAGTTPTLNLGGILLVDATTATAGNFQLSGPTDFGFTELVLVFDAPTSNFLLVTAPDTEVFEIGRLSAAVTNTWNQSADAWSARMTELRDVSWSGLQRRDDGFEMWAQAYGGTEGQDQVRTFTAGATTSTADLSYDQDFQGFQLGGDVQATMGGVTTVFGLTTGIGQSDMELASGNGIDIQGANVGAYFGATAGGFFLNGLVKADRFEVTVNALSAFVRAQADGSSYGAKGEVGYRMNLGGFFVEPVATLAYSDADIDDLTVPGGTFTFDDQESLRGEAGIRMGGDFGMANGTRYQPFIGVFAVEEFEGQSSTVFTSGGVPFALTEVEPDTYGRVSLGVNMLNLDGVNLFVRGDAAFGGEASGGSVRLGARWSF